MAGDFSLTGFRVHGPSAGLRVRVALVAVVLGTSLTACTQPSPSIPSAATLTIGVVARGDLNEIRRELTTERLINTAPDGRAEPGLATDWTISDDGLVVTLHLRPGVTFHDGEPLSAEGVRDVLDATRRDPAALQLFPTLRDIRAVRAVDELTVRVDFEHAAHLQFDGLKMRLEREVDGQPLGTGPFRVEAQTPERVVLAVNPEYHLGTSAIDRIEVDTFPTLRAAWASMMRGEVDFLFQVPIGSRDFVEAEPDVELFRLDTPYAEMIGLNAEAEKFRDRRVRQALNYAIDRRAVIEGAYAGEGTPASGVWATHWVYGSVDRVYPYDPVRADELLTEAGYSTSAHAPDASNRPPSRLRFTCLVAEGDELVELTALNVQRQLYEIGVDMQLEAMDGRSIQRRVMMGEYDAVLKPQPTGRALSRLYAFWHSSEPFAFFGYSATDDDLGALRLASTEAELAAAARGIQRTLFEDPPGIFLVNLTQARAVSRRFVVPNPLERDVAQTVWQWQPTPSTISDEGS